MRTIRNLATGLLGLVIAASVSWGDVRGVATPSTLLSPTTIPTPASGTALTIGDNTDAKTYLIAGKVRLSTGVVFSGTNPEISETSGNLNIGTTGGGVVNLLANGNQKIVLSHTAGLPGVKIADAAGTQFNAGFLESPINGQATPYTAVLADSDKTLYYSAAGAPTFTIPANASVAFPIGTVLNFVNDASAAVSMTIAITTDTLVLSPGGTTGSRTLAQFGVATARKVTATRWIISGSGLT